MLANGQSADAEGKSDSRRTASNRWTGFGSVTHSVCLCAPRLRDTAIGSHDRVRCRYRRNRLRRQVRAFRHGVDDDCRRHVAARSGVDRDLATPAARAREAFQIWKRGRRFFVFNCVRPAPTISSQTQIATAHRKVGSLPALAPAIEPKSWSRQPKSIGA
jgi:hypothetical protein